MTALIEELLRASDEDLARLHQRLREAVGRAAHRRRVAESDVATREHLAGQLARIERDIATLERERDGWQRVEARLREALKEAEDRGDDRAAENISHDLADLTERGFESVGWGGLVAHGPVFEIAAEEGLGKRLNRAHVDFDAAIAELEGQRAAIAEKLERTAA